ncbi:MAG: HAD-IC family P-type ATPase [Proteobacteria bacterium]|nr:HAD-IC family P-type ATPase [Pseudomonadota bacterium]
MQVSLTAGPGLTMEDVRRIRQQYGWNAVEQTAPALWRRLIGKFWAPVPWMLEAAILLQFMLHEYLEALVIAVLLVFNAALGWFQEQRAQATLDTLKSRLALLAVVRRDSLWQTLAASELVPGDILKLTLGGIVPADVRLLDGSVLLDQSMLTGESLPVEGGPGNSSFAGALVRRGEAIAEVTATGTRTKFGKTAELVRVAHGRSSQQQAVLWVVRNLAAFSGILVLVQLTYAAVHGMPGMETIPLVLTAVLAAIPVALPATFTLASAVAARGLAKIGVLPTRLSAVDEAATLDVLCSDKTGTLTQNALAVTAVHAVPGWNEGVVLGFAALASAESGTDPVDAAIRAAALRSPAERLPTRTRFVPFDPAQKMSEADVRDADGRRLRILKGAFARIAQVAEPMPDVAAAALSAFEKQGFRVLAVAAGAEAPLAWVGLIALSDPPRPDARQLIEELKQLGVRTVMATGDAAPTASVIARAVGLDGPLCPAGPVPERIEPGQFSVFAGIFPEDKFRLVRAFQASGHTVGMCGDGANDAPALRQAQMGIAVSTATDVAKSAAGIVLTQPGLGGIVQAVRAGRVTYERILTYTLRSVTAKMSQMLFLTIGLLITGHAVLTPMLMVLIMIGGDFLAMSATTDHVRPSLKPNVWRIGQVTVAAAVLGICGLLFCVAILLAGIQFGLATGHGLRTLAAVALVCSSQATFYVVRDRQRLWSSRPSSWVLVSSVFDVSIIALFAGNGFLMHRLPWSIIGMVVLAAALFMLLLDAVKSLLFRRLQVA